MICSLCLKIQLIFYTSKLQTKKGLQEANRNKTVQNWHQYLRLMSYIKKLSFIRSHKTLCITAEATRLHPFWDGTSFYVAIRSS